MSEYEALALDQVQTLATECLLANGCDEDNATPVAQSMTAAERDGCPSHGVFRLPGYVAGLRHGRINGKARPTVTALGEAVVCVEGDMAMAPVAHDASFGQLTERARTCGVAALGLTRVFHFSALWVEIEALTDQGLCAYACTSYLPVMAPAGGREPLYGTNPIAFGWPRKKGAVIFDQATAAMARGEIQLAKRSGEQVETGVGLDQDGNPTTDPAAILAGMQLPFGGYKGSSLALMVELLAGPLLRENLSLDAVTEDAGDGGPPPGGELLLAIDPNMFGEGDDWEERSERLFGRIEEMEGTRLPSQRRYINRERSLTEGVAIPKQLCDKIRELTSG